ncbi:MAG: GFA family protein [Gammaproteobacteria bacterium]|jgi:hypothetical protein|nr:GFA family protein [Gammaproteobacteria bacterium]
MIEGGCLCDAVRFSVEEFYFGVFKCHCSLCRKAFGGASSAAALCRADRFSWVKGESTVRQYQRSSGFLRRFCAHCGSIVPQHLPDFDAFWVPAGLLENAESLELRQHIHVDSKAHWERLDALTRQLPEGF